MYMASKTTLVLHTITSPHINRFLYFLAEMLLRQDAIEWLFAIAPLLPNGSALPLPGETRTREIVFSENDSGKVRIRRDHPYRRIEMEFFVVGDLQKAVLRFEFHQNRSSGFRAVGSRNLPFINDWAVGLYKIVSQSARMSKIKDGGLDQYGAQRFGRLVGWVYVRFPESHFPGKTFPGKVIQTSLSVVFGQAQSEADPGF